jgi:predicted nucleic acid-binding Zn ribbon protein
MSAKPKRKCPDCGKLKAKRMISAGAGVIFKGDGFYQTDYRSDSYKRDAAADKKAQETKSDSKSDSSSSKGDSSATKSESKSSKSE